MYNEIKLQEDGDIELGNNNNNGNNKDNNDNNNIENNKIKNWLQFKISYTVNNKQILNNIRGNLLSTDCLAIMGPSGAGKTTLLNILTLDNNSNNTNNSLESIKKLKNKFYNNNNNNNNNNTIDNNNIENNNKIIGEIYYNNIKMNSILFKNKCCIVNQDDHHWSMLTCEETIKYAIKLYYYHNYNNNKDNINNSFEDIDIITNKMLKNTGLESCKDVIVGNIYKKGLSGGQKRRLSVAVALLKRLEILYLDEPTSGLDSASAASIMLFITQITKLHNLICLVTIHQPSTAVFNYFNKVMILSKGCVAYSGIAGNDALNYFASIGHVIDNNTNPADFMVDLVNSDFNDVKIVNNILQLWKDSNHDDIMEEYCEKECNVVFDESKILLSCTYSSITNEMLLLFDNFEIYQIYKQTLILLHRHTLLSIRDPFLFIGRMLIFLIACLFFAIIYIAARNLQQDQILNRMWYILWCIGMPANMAVIAVYTYNHEFFAIKREAKNGMTSPIAYIIAMNIIQIPVMILFGICSLTIGGYGILQFNGNHYINVIIIYSFVLFCFEGFAQVFSILFDNALMGMLNFMQIWFAAFLFAGVVIPLDNVVYPFKIFGFILPLKYGFQAILYEEFIDQTFNGAEICNPQIDTSGFCHYDTNYIQSTDGWTCGYNYNLCYGKTGEQVLNQLHRLFPTITSNNTTYFDIGILCSIAIILKCIHSYIMIKKCIVNDTIHPE